MLSILLRELLITVLFLMIIISHLMSLIQYASISAPPIIVGPTEICPWSHLPTSLLMGTPLLAKVSFLLVVRKPGITSTNPFAGDDSAASSFLCKWRVLLFYWLHPFGYFLMGISQM